MKLKFYLLMIIFSNTFLFSQNYYAKEYSKDVALYNSKNYLFKTVLGSTVELAKFEIIPLAAASSGDLTTLLYKCESKQKKV